MDSYWQDVRFSLRGWRKRPGFTAVAVLTIGLGIGASTAIFSIVNGVLLQPLPLEEPATLVSPDVISALGHEISLSIPNFREWRERNRTLESFGANASRNKTLTGGGTAEIVNTRLILGDYFETLGVKAAMGRTIASDETWAGAEPVAVVTHGFWQRRLGGASDVLGKAINLDAQTFSVIGVLPPEFVFPSATTEVFIPMGFFSENMCWEIRDCSQGTWAIGRLAEGVPIETAQADLERIQREISDEEGTEAAVARLETLSDAYLGETRAPVWILMGAVSFVLLIACANVAGLLLARGEGRRREIAVRTALGAGRGRVVRQLMTESLMLALGGGIVGVAIGWAGLRAMMPWIAENAPSIVAGRVGLDPLVLAFCFAATLVSGVLFGLVPALRVAKTDLATQIKEGARDTGGRGQQRLRSALVVAEVGLALVLLIGAGLMIKSFSALQSVDVGFRPENIMTARISLPAVHFDEKEETWQFYERYLERVEALPGVERASLTNTVPLGGSNWERGVFPEGIEMTPENGASILYQFVSLGHFDVLGVPLLRGRTFDGSDRDGTLLVTVIDHTMAERFWPGKDPIGKRITFESGDAEEGETPPRIWRTVVGVVQNTRHYEIESPSRIQVYIPMQQSRTSWSRGMSIMVKTAGDPRTMVEPLRRELAVLNPDIPLDRVETLEGYVDRAMSPTKVVSGLLTVFSAIALGLAALGVFGVMSFTVVQRVREIGIHMALGARASDVLRMIGRQGLVITGLGVVLGLAAAAALTRLMGGVLYNVDPVDPVTYATITAALFAVSMLASYLPARRATRVDPAIVLRDQ